jgi:hypothetical protein
LGLGAKFYPTNQNGRRTGSQKGDGPTMDDGRTTDGGTILLVPPVLEAWRNMDGGKNGKEYFSASRNICLKLLINVHFTNMDRSRT